MTTATKAKPIAIAGADSSPRCAVSTGSPPWKPGMWAIVAVVGGPSHVYIMSIDDKSADLLGVDGSIIYRAPCYLLSVQGYIEHADRMADEWTGREYREAVEKARNPPALHPDWPKWLARASEPLENR